MRSNSTRMFLFFMTCGMLSCADLALTSRGICGNHIVEQGEHCDGSDSRGGTCSESCVFICAGESTPCPDGFRCGNDSICRKASGYFESRGIFDLPTTQITLADMDAGGRLALVATRDVTTKVAYLDETGLSLIEPTLTAIPSVPGDRPSLGDINGDGATDLVQIDSSAIRVTLSTPTRALTNKAFPDPLDLTSLQGMFVGNFLHLVPGHNVISVDALGLRTVGDPNGPSMGPVSAPIYFYHWSVNQVVKSKSVVMADLVDDPQIPLGDEIVLAVAGDSRVLVIEPLGLDVGKLGWNSNGNLRAATEIKLPPGAKVTGPIWARRLGPSSTKPMDLLIFGENAAGEKRLFVAFNAGNRAFYPVPTFAGTMGTAGVFDTHNPSASTALNAAHLNGDGIIDFILPTGTLISTCDSLTLDCNVEVDPAAPTLLVQASYEWRQTSAVSWTEVQILPNASGRNVDFVSMSSTAIVVHRNAGNGVFNDFELFMPNPPRHLTLEDFDGDGMQDLIFTQKSYALCGNAEDTNGETLLISYRNALGTPTEPVPIVDLHSIRQIVAGQVYSIAGKFAPDGIADLLVWTSAANQSPSEGLCTEALPNAAYTFPGHSGRLLNAPIDVAQACSGALQTDWYPLRVVAGNFDAEVGTDLAIVAQKKSMTPGGGNTAEIPTLMLASNVDQGIDMCTATNQPAALMFPTMMPMPNSMPFAKLDLEGDGRDEVLFSRISSNLYAIGRLVENGGVKTWDVETLTTEWSYSDVIPMKITHQGGHDLVFVRKDAKPPEVVIQWSSSYAPATLDGSPTRIVSEQRSCPRPKNAQPAIFRVVPIDVDTDQENELMMLVDGGLQIYDLSPSKPPRMLREICLPKWDIPLTSIAAGDINGDGLDDFVVSSLAGTAIFQGLEARP